MQQKSRLRRYVALYNEYFGGGMNAIVIRTDRTTSRNILNKYLYDRELGVTEPRNKQIFEVAQPLTLEDIFGY